MSALFQLLRTRHRTRASDPIITWYGPNDARMELSAATFATAVAKTAGLLTDELEAVAGNTIVIDLPLHWQLPVWLAAADVAGLSIAIGTNSLPEPDFGVYSTRDDAESGSAGTSIVTSTTPFGLPGDPLPGSLVDHARESLAQPDVFQADPRAGRLLLAGQWWPSHDLAQTAATAARGWGLQTGGRLLCTLAVTEPACPLAVWVAPLELTGSVVLVQEGDPSAISRVEAVTATT